MRVLIAAIIASVWLAAPARAQTPPPVEAFGRLPAVSDAAISPDGTKVALAINNNDQSALAIFDLAQQRVTFTAGVGPEQQLRSVGWADDAHASFVISTAVRPGEVMPANYYYRDAPQRLMFSRPGVLNISTRRMKLLSTNGEAFLDRGSQLVAPIEGEPGAGRLIGSAGYDPDFLTVFRVNLDTGVTQALNPRGVNLNAYSYLLGAHGEVLARTDVDEHTNRWSLYAYNDDTPHLLSSDVSSTGAPAIVPRGLLSNGRLALVGENDAKDFYTLFSVDRVSGARELLFENPAYDVDDAISDPWTHEVVGVTWTEDEVKQRFFDAGLQSAYEHVIAQFGGAAHIVSWSRDRSRLVVYGERGLDGGAFYIYESATGHIARISYCYPELAALQSGAVREAITYRARDGTHIPAYLTLPSAGAHNLPLVVLVHGGPSGRDGLAFDWWAAFLASRGYAVLQPNYRGSSGYGRAWENAGLGEWGGLMQTDVEDGIAPLGRSGIVDPARVCIAGASYGGYVALAGATLTPDSYKCAICVAGLSDLTDLVTHREAQTGATSIESDYWRQSIGDLHDDGAHLRNISPANLANRVHIPVLLIHGTNDTIVPIDQSRRMRNRLNGAGKSVRYVELPGDDHWLSNAPTRIQMLREIGNFLAQNLPVQPAQ